jgi:MFS family permease
MACRLPSHAIPFVGELRTTMAQLQVTFSILIVLQTFLSPCQEFLIDRFGPRLLLSATLTDTFGAEHATANYGFLYMAQGVGSVFGGPLASLLHDKAGSWIPVFALMIAIDLVAALLAFFALKPLRRRYLEAAAPG